MTQNKLFHFELVSPERKLISEEAYMVTLPGTEGDVGVLAGHMALVTTVRVGIVDVVRAQGGAKERIFVAGGFADISQKNCTLLAEEAIPVVALDMQKLVKEKETLNDDLSFADNGEEKMRITKRMSVVNAMIEAVQAA